MADDADNASREAEFLEFLRKPEPVNLTFTQGDCMDCGEHSTLVDSVCGPCRADAERRAQP